MAIGEEGAASGAGGGVGANVGVSKGRTEVNYSDFEKLFADKDLEALRALIGGEIFNLAGTRGMYSRENAMKDSAGLVEGLARQLQEKLLPQVGANESMAGSYDSTSKKQLGNDLISRVAEQAAGLQMQTVKDYASMEALQMQPLLELFGLLKGADASKKGRKVEKNQSLGFNLGIGL